MVAAVPFGNRIFGVVAEMIGRGKGGGESGCGPDPFVDGNRLIIGKIEEFQAHSGFNRGFSGKLSFPDYFAAALDFVVEWRR